MEETTPNASPNARLRTSKEKARVTAMLLIECILILPVYSAYALSIQNLQVRDFTATSTTAAWTTDKLSNSSAFWGQAGINEANRSIRESVVQHSLVMDTQANKTYLFAVQSCASDNDCFKTAPAQFHAGIDASAPFVNATIPDVINTNRIDLRVATKPFSTVKVFLEGAISRIANPSDTATGEVVFHGIAFPKEKNTLRLESVDSSGGRAELTIIVTVDATPPILEIRNFPDVTQQPSIALQGKVTKQSKVGIFVMQQLDNTPPPRPENIKLKGLAPNQAAISWDPVLDKDIGEYGVVRNNKLIATTKSTEFTDETPSGGRTFNYRVQAVDSSCNKGDISSSIDIAVPEGRTDMPSPIDVKYACEQPAFILDAQGEFSQQIPLQAGQTQIRVVATDRAGNTATFTNTTIFDNVPPQFITTNLDALSPSYTQMVTIRGRVSEKSTVFVTINNEQTPSSFAATEDDGTFSIKVKLRRDTRAGETQAGKSPTQKVGLREGESQGFLNTIKLKAVDIAQNSAETTPTQVILAQCGFGTGFSVDIGKPKPDMLNPRLILKNFGTVGFNVELKYLDQPETLDFLDTPSLLIRPVSLQDQPKFDLDLDRSIRCTQDNMKCYVQLKVRPPPGTDEKQTTFEKEELISEHRKDDCLIPGVGCYKIPLELEIRYQKKQPTADLNQQRERFGTLGPRIEPLVQKVCMPVEIAIDKRLDPKLLPNSFLKSSVELFDSGIKAIDDILKPLQTVFNIVFYACYLGFTVGFFLDFSQRKSCEGAVIAGLLSDGAFNPEVAENGLCNAYYPENDPKKELSRQNCLRCQASINTKKETLQNMHQLCDRIFCPSAPSLQKWITDMQRKGVKHRTAPTAGTAGSGAAKEFFIGSDCASQFIKPNLFQGNEGKNELGIDDIYQLYKLHKNDKATEDKGTPLESLTASIPKITHEAPAGPATKGEGSAGSAPEAFGESPTTAGGSTAEGTTERTAAGSALVSRVQGKTRINCANSHPMLTECCGVEYQREWGPVCSILIPDFEITESRCLSAQQTGSGAVEGCTGFRKALNAIGGFCTPSGDIAPNLVATKIAYGRLASDEQQDPLADVEKQKNKQREATEKEKGVLITESRTIFASEEERKQSQEATNQAILGLYADRTLEQDITRGRIPDYVKDRQVYLRIIPEEGGSFKVLRGYVIEKAVLSDLPSLDPKEKKASLTETLDFVPDLDLTSYFQAPKEGGPILYTTIENRWVNALCSRELAPSAPGSAPGNERATLPEGAIAPAGKGKSAMTGCSKKTAREAWDEVKRKVGVGSKDYIVNPAEDLSSSIKCACLPGITTHLKKWKGILTAVRNCFNAILVTGDGTPGACEAVLSRYVCDFMYTLIKCFVQRYTAGNDRPDSAGGIGGGLLGIGSIGKMLVRSGTSITEDLQKRYGNSPTYKAAFSEQKMVNSICLFAFTGTFNLAPDALAETDIGSIPVDSQPFTFPCERRFIQFDVSSNPPGLATWNYHIGADLFAGADLTYALKLKCSAGFDCEASEGFQNGQCDCAKIGEKTQTISSGNLKQFENIGEKGEIFENVQSRYRYDRAILDWQYRDKDGKAQTGKQECKIETIGGDAPNFCAFDILEDSFRCSVDMFSEFFAKFSGDVQPNYPDPLAQIFKLDDDVSFSLPIVQRIPDGAPCSGGRTCASTKYLIYTIRNGQGTIIATNDQGTFDPSKEGAESTTDVTAFADITDEQVLSTQGEKIYTIRLGQLNEDLFNRAARQTGSKITNIEVDPSDIQEFITVSREAGKTTPSFDLFITSINLKTGTYRAARRGPDGKPGETIPDAVSSTIQTAGDAAIIRTQGYIISISSLSKASNLKTIFIPPFQAPRIEKRCDRSKLSITPESWHATFEIRDAEQKQLGEHSTGTQVSVVNGRAQRKDLSFKVICNTGLPQGKQRGECTEGRTPRTACHCYPTREKVSAAIAKDTPGNCGKVQGQACLDGTCVNTGGGKICPRDTVLEEKDDKCLCGFNEGGEVRCKIGGMCVYGGANGEYGPNVCLKAGPPSDTSGDTSGGGGSILLTSSPVVTTEQLLTVINDRRPRRGGNEALALAFKNAGTETGIDPAFLIGLAVAESSLGTANTNLVKDCNNMFSVKARAGRDACPASSDYAKYDSFEAAIQDAAKLLATDYLSKNQDTVEKIGGAFSQCRAPGIETTYPCCAEGKPEGHCYCCPTESAFIDWKNNIITMRNQVRAVPITA